ncbi:hypothetical protein GCM10023144_13620 [Pigmentiphaga soli]|uniref:Uncharacterized protein n=1 Tax=Pigmentiphaga soli TaxID=1007095 RepID=A0ABP8GQH8_9BURK
MAGDRRACRRAAHAAMPILGSVMFTRKVKVDATVRDIGIREGKREWPRRAVAGSIVPVTV